MEFISKEEIVELSNPGVVSRQLLNPDNSSSKRVTSTEVHLEISASQPRHTHDSSEQIWLSTKFSPILTQAPSISNAVFPALSFFHAINLLYTLRFNSIISHLSMQITFSSFYDNLLSHFFKFTLEQKSPMRCYNPDLMGDFTLLKTSQSIFQSNI